MAESKSTLFSWTSPVTAKSTVALSLIECSSEKLSVCPTLEEVIAFGGIPKTSLGVRTSNRMGCQSDEDMPRWRRQ
jgi:hypothetical protein